jgi:hypothetical protein
MARLPACEVGGACPPGRCAQLHRRPGGVGAQSGSLIKPLISTGAGKGTLPFGLAITPDGATAYVNGQNGPKKPSGDR